MTTLAGGAAASPRGAERSVALALGMHFACRGRTLGRGALRVPLAVLVPLLLAVGEELVQAASPHRSADPLDLLADLLDLLGLLVFWQLGRRLHDT